MPMSPTGGEGLRVVDISDPLVPTAVGVYDPPEWVLNIAVASGYAYVTAETSGLRAIDVTHPASPVEVGAYRTVGVARGIAVAGQHAYLIDAWFPPILQRSAQLTRPGTPTA